MPFHSLGQECDLRWEDAMRLVSTMPCFVSAKLVNENAKPIKQNIGNNMSFLFLFTGTRSYLTTERDELKLNGSFHHLHVL